jgi:hypothetical protein
MNNFNRRVLFLMCISLLPACTAVPVPEASSQPALSIAGMIIRNDLFYPVTEVMISVPETGAFAGCGNILPESRCQTSFEAVDYSGNAMVVSWKEHGQDHSTKEFVVEPGKDIDASKPAWLEITIFAAGQAGAKFVQPPG